MENEKVYGRNIIRNSSAATPSKAKRILVILLAAAFLLGGILGGVIAGFAVHNYNKTAEIEKTPIQVVYSPLGAGDNRIITTEISPEWSNGNELGFIPLNVPLDEDVQEFIYCLSYAYNIDWALVMAMIECESGFQSDIISSGGDYGLMQINEINHPWLSEALGVTDFLDAKQNVKSGLFILRRLFEKYGDDPHKVLMAYNMGEYGASELWEQKIFSTAYSEKVSEIQMKFQNELKGKGENNVN